MTNHGRSESGSAARDPSLPRLLPPRLDTARVVQRFHRGESGEERSRRSAARRCSAAGRPGTARTVAVATHRLRVATQSPRTRTRSSVRAEAPCRFLHALRWSRCAGRGGPSSRCTAPHPVHGHALANSSSPRASSSRRARPERSRASPIAESISVIARPARTIPIQPGAALRRLALEHGAPALGLDEAEAERLGHGRRRQLAGGHQLHELEPRARHHLAAQNASGSSAGTRPRAGLAHAGGRPADGVAGSARPRPRTQAVWLSCVVTAC